MKDDRWIAWLPMALFALLIAVFAVSAGGGMRATFASHVGALAPALAAAGKADPLAPRRGKVTLVNFFASWCAPCREENALLLRLKKRGVAIVGVAYKDKTPAMRAFLKKSGNPFAALVEDREGRIGLDWGLTGVPETYLVDRAGVIRFHQAGPLTEEMVEREIVPLLGAKP